MVIVGVDGDGTTRFETDLDHGMHLDALAFEHGYIVLRPLEARIVDSDLRLRLLVRPAAGEPGPVPATPPLDPGLVLTEDDEPIVRQRVAAYAVVLSDLGLLATQYSDRTAVAGRWGMPGGGLDDAEEPTACVLREVDEETSQPISLGPLTRVQTAHWIGVNPHGMIEDFHAVRLVYSATCAAPSEPVVQEQDGTTASARWISLDAWPSLDWTANWQRILADLLGPSSSGVQGGRPPCLI
jgi:8-oxo-dGTP pyrophosphatase MutT (NUDIX family)